MIKRYWKRLWKPSAKYSLGALLIVGGIGGIVFWGGFNTFMEYTNSLEFCISCHEMKSTVYEEYKKTPHYSNPSGVRAICSDCHVPKQWTPKLIRKIKASNELFHWMMGTINTPEKFEAHRLEMAERVWASMKASDSRECRNCHNAHSPVSYSINQWPGNLEYMGDYGGLEGDGYILVQQYLQTHAKALLVHDKSPKTKPTESDAEDD